MIIKEINESDYAEFKNDAINEGILFSKNSIYHGLYNNNKLVAISAILIRKHSAVMKCNFVPVEYRGNGYHKKLLAYELALLTKMNIKKINAHCTKLSLNNYLKFGFKKVKTYKNGITEVIYENI